MGNRKSMWTSPLVAGPVWGFVELGALLMSVLIGMSLGSQYWKATNTDLGWQTSFVFIFIVSLVTGFLVKDIYNSMKALLIAQTIALGLFAVVLPSTQTEIGTALADSTSDQFPIAITFLVGFMIVSLFVALAGCAAGNFLGGRNNDRKMNTPIVQSTNDVSPIGRDPITTSPWTGSMEKRRKEAEERRQEQK